MPREINLLPEKELKQTKLALFGKKLMLVGSALLVILAIAVIITFIFWQSQVLNNKKITDEISQKSTEISTYQESEILQRVLKDKINKYKQYTSQRRDYYQVVSDIESVITEGVSLNDLQVGKDGKISFSGQAKNSLYLSNFFLTIIDPDKGAKILDNISIDKLLNTQDGSYQFSLNAILKGTKKES